MTAATPNLIDSPGTPETAWRGWPRLARLPSADLAGLRSAVVLAAHPDDEVLGAGGTLSLLASAGVRLRLVSVTDGEASHPGVNDRNALAERRTAETTAALRELGADSAEVIRLRFPDTGLPLILDELTAVLSNLARGFDVCLAPWEKDGHADHEAVGRAARQAALSLSTTRSGCGTGRSRPTAGCRGTGRARSRFPRLRPPGSARRSAVSPASWRHERPHWAPF